MSLLSRSLRTPFDSSDHLLESTMIPISVKDILAQSLQRRAISVIRVTSATTRLMTAVVGLSMLTSFL